MRRGTKDFCIKDDLKVQFGGFYDGNVICLTQIRTRDSLFSSRLIRFGGSRKYTRDTGAFKETSFKTFALDFRRRSSQRSMS